MAIGIAASQLSLFAAQSVAGRRSTLEQLLEGAGPMQAAIRSHGLLANSAGTTPPVGFGLSDGTNLANLAVLAQLLGQSGLASAAAAEPAAPPVEPATAAPSLPQPVAAPPPPVTVPPSPQPGPGGKTLTVGAGQQYSTIGAALSMAKSGDTILIEPGTYVDQTAAVSKNVNIQEIDGARAPSADRADTSPRRAPSSTAAAAPEDQPRPTGYTASGTAVFNRPPPILDFSA